MTFSLTLNWTFKYFSFSQTNSHFIFTNYETLIHLTSFRPRFFHFKPCPLPSHIFPLSPFLPLPSHNFSPLPHFFFTLLLISPGLISPYSTPEFWFPFFPIINLISSLYLLLYFLHYLVVDMAV